jgi:hypothetical protein
MGLVFCWFKDKVVNLDSSLNFIGEKPEIFIYMILRWILILGALV